MPGFDWIPGISQLKSTVQLITGDFEGAARTQENFLKECPGVSQVTSVAQVLTGDSKGALETQKRCLGTINNVANGLPVVGHVKGVIHHAVGDHKGGHEALNAATRTTVVLGAGAAAAVTTGGLAAIPAGIAAGGAFDLLDSTLTDTPKGIVSAVGNAVINPNGGNIFDATAAIVGDGMTGYAGGNIGTKIANDVKLGQLEAAQTAKVDQFTNEIQFGEMSTGDALKLGNEIKSLTNDINAIKNQGIPQYYHDRKTNSIVVEYTKGPVNVPAVPGLAFERPEISGEKAQQQRPQQAVQVVEDGVDCDLYADEPLTCNLSQYEKEAILRKYEQQIPQERRVTDQHPNTKLPTQAEFDRIRQDRQPPQNTADERIAELTLQGWLHIRMPPNFGYTSAGLLNHTRQGFLHTFARHWDQWMQFIPEIGTIMGRELWVLQPILRQIQNAPNPHAVQAPNQQLTSFLASCRDETVLAALRRVQILICGYMQHHLVSANYVGEGLNGRGQVQVYFKVGNNQCMVVCVSRELTPAVPDFVDSRPVRTITTVFFIDENELAKVLIRAVWKK